jgi:hypothetical protein
MYRRYLTLAGTVAFGSATLFVMSGCSSRSPQPSNQAYSTTTYMTSQGAPVYSSDDAWQRGSNPGPAPKASQPVVEAAGSDAQTQQAQVQTQTRQAAPATTPRNYNAQSQSDDSWMLESPRSSDNAPHADVPAYDQRARSQSQSSSSSAQVNSRRSNTSSAPMMATTPMITEGANSGGQWNPGLTDGTRGPEVSTQQGWVPGYYNPDFHQQRTTIRESAGSSTGNLQQQLNEQQRQLNQQQQQINQQQRELQRLHQQKQQAPSDNSTQ